MFPDIMSIFNSIGRWCGNVAAVFAQELKLIRTDMGALIFFVLLPLMYPVIYTLIYNTEVVRELPVAVVDSSRTPESRELVRTASASPTILIYDYCNDMAEAEALMAETKVFGVMHIPYDYASRIARGEQTNVEFYADMSLLLRYRALVAALSDIQIKICGDIASEKISGAGLESLIGGSAMPIESKSNFLGDVEQGFASFVIPGIVVIILQQSMMLGIMLLGGTARERRRRNGGIDPEAVQGAGASATVWGRTLCYFVIYIAMTLYCLRIVPEMFNLPHYGSPVQYLVFIMPLLLASAFLGQTLIIFAKERESAFLILVSTSVIWLFLSGLTWPRYAMPRIWYWIGNLIPSTWGVEGFIRINSNSASIAENAHPYIMLWVLSAVYMLTAIWVAKYVDVSSRLKYGQKPAALK